MHICADCVGDHFLKNEILTKGAPSVICAFCGIGSWAIPFDDLAERVDTVLSLYYQSTGYDYEEFLNVGGSPLYEVLTDELAFPDVVAANLKEKLEDQWFDPEDNLYLHGEEPHFIAKSSLDSPLSEAWRAMEDSLKYEARLANPLVLKLLSEVFDGVARDRVEDQSGVIVELEPGEIGSQFYRARAYETTDELQADMSKPEQNLGPHPKGRGRAGRMNALGISAFYGAMDPTVALAEVRPPVGSYVVMGRFSAVRSLRLLDLDKLTKLSKPVGSKFNQGIYEKRSRRDFLKKLTSKLTRPVGPRSTGLDYLITQAVTDYLATNERLKLDGVLYRSTQLEPDGDEHLDTRNVVLFYKSSRVEDPGVDGKVQGTRFSLRHGDNEEVASGALLTTISRRTSRLNPFAQSEDERSVVLRLDRSSLAVLRVKGVSFSTSPLPVKHQIRSEDDPFDPRHGF